MTQDGWITLHDGSSMLSCRARETGRPGLEWRMSWGSGSRQKRTWTQYEDAMSPFTKTHFRSGLEGLKEVLNGSPEAAVEEWRSLVVEGMDVLVQEWSVSSGTSSWKYEGPVRVSVMNELRDRFAMMVGEPGFLNVENPMVFDTLCDFLKKSDRIMRLTSGEVSRFLRQAGIEVAHVVGDAPSTRDVGADRTVIFILTLNRPNSTPLLSYVYVQRNWVVSSLQWYENPVDLAAAVADRVESSAIVEDQYDRVPDDMNRFRQFIEDQYPGSWDEFFFLSTIVM